MAKCKACGQDMTTADSCTANEVIEFPDGSKMPGIPYRGPTIEELEKSLEWWKKAPFPEEVKKQGISNIEQHIEAMKKDPNNKQRCHDCGVKDGGFHHPRCDSEICPKCGGQIITCGCLEAK